TVGRVLAAGCVAIECKLTVGRVQFARRVVPERLHSSGGVGAAVCVVKECFKTGGRVFGAGQIATERSCTHCRVVMADCVTKQRLRADGRVEDAVVRIPAAGWGGPDVTKERLKTHGRVVVTGGVETESKSTVGCVGGAGCVVTERLRTSS